MTHNNTPPHILDTTHISRSDSVIEVPVNGELLMMDIDRGHYYGLDRIGADIWARIETPVTFADLIDGLALDYDAEREQIADDVRRMLAVMVKHRAVSIA